MTVLARALAWIRGPESTPPSRGDTAALLARYAAANAKKSEADRELRALRADVEAVPADEVFSGWRKRYGSSRKIIDREAVEQLLAPREVPMTDSAPSLIVEYVGERREGDG